jgi:sugar-specific transcriptional regulator TrmB
LALGNAMNEAQHLDIIQAPAEIQSELDRYLTAIESAEQRMKKDQEEIDFLRAGTREVLDRINAILNDVEAANLSS